MSKQGWIGVDLDGTLAEYHGWQGATHIGEPVALMVERVTRWLEEGREVKIMTARVSHPAQAADCRVAISLWLEKQGLPNLEVTNVKDYGMIELWDDRAVAVEANTGMQLSPSRRGL